MNMLQYALHKPVLTRPATLVHALNDYDHHGTSMLAHTLLWYAVDQHHVQWNS